MMSWFSIATTVLKIVNTIVQWANRQSLIDAGEQKEIAKQTVAILRSAGVSKDLIAEIATLNDIELAERLDESDFIQ